MNISAKLERQQFQGALKRFSKEMKLYGGKGRLSLSGETWSAMLDGLVDLCRAVDYAVETCAYAQKNSQNALRTANLAFNAHDILIAKLEKDQAAGARQRKATHKARKRNA